MSTVSLFNWDTVNVVGFNTINPLILADNTTPNLSGNPFNYSSSKHDSIDGCTFYSWALTNGGQGTNLNMKAQTLTGTATIGGTTVQLANQHIVFQVNLNFINESGDSSDPYKLMVASSSQNPVTVISTDFDNNSSLSLAVKAGIKGLFEDYLNANIANFSQVFHTALLQPATGSLPWLQPSAVGYAVSSGQTEKTSSFAVLILTEGRTISGQSHQIDPDLLGTLPDGANAVLAISQKLIVEKLLLPAALAVFDSAKETDFQIVGDDVVVQNVNPLTWGNFVLEDGTTVSPTVPAKGFSISVSGADGDRITLSFTGVTFSTPVSTGGNVITTMSYTQTLFLIYDSKTGHLVPSIIDPSTSQPAPLQDIQVTSSPDAKAQAIEWIEIGIGAALTLIGLVGGVLKAASYIKSIASAATVTDGAATAAIDGTQLQPRIIYGQLPGDGTGAPPTPIYDVVPNVGGSIRGCFASMSTGVKVGLGFLAAVSGGLEITALASYLKNQSVESFVTGNADGAPAFKSFTDAMLARSVWIQFQDWTPVSAKLNGALIIYGNLTSKT